MPRITQTPSRRKRRQPEERRSQILDAALEVFEAQGLSGARLEDIAEEAGISKGTVYLYFDGKEALFRAVVERTIIGGMKEFAGRERTGTATERLTRIAADVWRHLRSRDFQIVYRLVTGELHRFPELAKFYSERVPATATRSLAGTIETGVRSGEFVKVAPLPTARCMMATLLTYSMWCERQALFPKWARQTDDEALAGILEFFLRSLNPAPAAGARKRR